MISMNLRDIDLKISFRYQGIHTIRGTLSIESLSDYLNFLILEFYRGIIYANTRHVITT